MQHREQTLVRRLQALCFAPLMGSDRLSACDTRAHPLQTWMGRGDQRATLSQLLGQRERVDAAASLLSVLGADRGGPSISVAGHMMASWSRRSMPQGTITMLGRIMAGSPGVMAHENTGQAVFGASSPPDIHGSHVIVASCQHVAEATGSTLCVIDRAVNSVALARACDAQDLGWLCLLDDHEQAGLGSVEPTVVDTLEEGTRVESGPWKACRHDAPRHGVMVAPPADTTLVSWGTPKVAEALDVREWPRVYRERHALQARSCKSMMDHGGLDITHGRQTLMAPDRHHQRQHEHLDASLETAHERVATQAEAVKNHQAKGAASEAQGHGTRLEQRQDTVVRGEQARKDATGKQAQLAAHAATLGPAGQRAARDVRQPTSMTMRTLFREHMLRALLAALRATWPLQGSWEQVLSLLCARRGAWVETPAQVVYWVNTAG